MYVNVIGKVPVYNTIISILFRRLVIHSLIVIDTQSIRVLVHVQ